MLIDLKKYFLSDDLSDTVTYELDLSQEDYNGVKPFPSPVKVCCSLKGFAGAVDLKAHLLYDIVMPCDRCCEETVQHKDVWFEHRLVRRLNDENDDSNYLVVPSERIDLDELLSEDILLDLPSKFLCSPDCKGLCPKCGVNLNRESCACDTAQVDPRLEILKNLLGQ